MMLLINPMATLLRRELSGRKPGMMTLVSLGIVDAFASSPFDSGLSWICRSPQFLLFVALKIELLFAWFAAYGAEFEKPP